MDHEIAPKVRNRGMKDTVRSRVLRSAIRSLVHSFRRSLSQAFVHSVSQSGVRSFSQTRRRADVQFRRSDAGVHFIHYSFAPKGCPLVLDQPHAREGHASTRVKSSRCERDCQKKKKKKKNEREKKRGRNFCERVRRYALEAV